MKIILTESQYKNLFESNFEKNKRLVGNMWDEGMNLGEISSLIGLDESQIILLLKDKNIKIDCKFAEDLVLTLMYRTDFINKNYNFNDGQMFLNLNWGGSSGSVAFEFNDKEYKLTGWATPYWGGNCDTPVESNYFENKKTDEYVNEYGNSDKKIEYTPSSFNSIQELIDFLNNDYPKQLIKPIKELIEDYI